MKTTYFTNCKTLEDLKHEYRRLAKVHHPDVGGDTATMQAIVNEYDELFRVLKDKHNATADDYHKTTETPEEFRTIIDQLLTLEGLTVELCGCWLWIGGNTKDHKDALKAMGCRWASKKKLWYWHHPEDSHWTHRGNQTIEKIREKYGSQKFEGGKEVYRKAVQA